MSKNILHPRKYIMCNNKNILNYKKNIFFRRRSKAHAGDLHSYCVSRGGGGGGGQFYDDLYISGQLGAGHATRGRGSNQYSAHHNTFYNRNQVSSTQQQAAAFACCSWCNFRAIILPETFSTLPHN